MGKRYELKTMQDLLAIPPEKLDDFIVDLKKWHSAVVSTMDLITTIAKATGEKQPENLITMVWIDDGKHDGKVIIKDAPTPDTPKKGGK